MKNLGSVVLLLLALAGCKKEGTESDEYFRFRENRWKWIKADIFDYSIDQSLNCFCVFTGKHRVKVVDDTVISATANNGQAVENPERYFKTIDELFDYIETSLKSDPYKVEIRYDETYGYPVFVYFDFDKNVADEEMGFAIDNFVEE